MRGANEIPGGRPSWPLAIMVGVPIGRTRAHVVNNMTDGWLSKLDHRACFGLSFLYIHTYAY